MSLDLYSLNQDMPVDNMELMLHISEIKTIQRFGVQGLDMPWERIEMYNLIMDSREKNG